MEIKPPMVYVDDSGRWKKGCTNQSRTRLLNILIRFTSHRIGITLWSLIRAPPLSWEPYDSNDKLLQDVSILGIQLSKAKTSFVTLPISFICCCASSFMSLDNKVPSNIRSGEKFQVFSIWSLICLTANCCASRLNRISSTSICACFSFSSFRFICTVHFPTTLLVSSQRYFRPSHLHVTVTTIDIQIFFGWLLLSSSSALVFLSECWADSFLHGDYVQSFIPSLVSTAISWSDHPLFAFSFIEPKRLFSTSPLLFAPIFLQRLHWLGKLFCGLLIEHQFRSCE